MAERLTVIIAVKNHEDLIGDCIASCREVADEILIADSGSSDGTLAAARRMCEGWCACTVVARNYLTACSFKNWAIPQAAHPWVLILDVDERLTDRLLEEIQRLLSGRPACDGYRVCRHNYFLGRRVRFAEWARDRVIRLFRRDQFRYADEEADHGEFPTAGLKIGRLRGPLNHFARRSYDEQLEKCNRYTALQARRWFEEGRRPRLMQLLLRPPARFLRSYLAYGGFLDGKVGIQIAYLAAYYAFLKQARLWELWQAKAAEQEERPAGERRAA
ncbi:MAG: glycosyltransferase [Planctomycetales bacterium]|nr:glycosyltransferase [Planctomycetales bacterium]NIM10122.1 glycosyltransferase [Planctomycetales bacterium]NIN09564.1 glycosyltransferase [Planctomycetales bacterium]NIN78676.1 glycosyltransferase [Planctomycetales bacterium]NIO35865.1 glycosyltransferase [Planctomycetales bacterium]